jgi:hypothetical protein
MDKKNNIIDIKFIFDKIIRYEKLGFSSEYIHVAIKAYIKAQLELDNSNNEIKTK